MTSRQSREYIIATAPTYHTTTHRRGGLPRIITLPHIDEASPTGGADGWDWAGTGRLAARRNARLLPTGRVARGVAQRSRAVHPLPPPRLETEQRSSPPPLPPPCAVRLTRRHSAPRHCSTWGPTAASAAAAAAGPTAAAPSQIRLGGDPRRRIAGLEPPITIPGHRDPRLRNLPAGTHTYGAGTHSCHSTPTGRLK